MRPGEQLPIYVDMSRVHFFEPGEMGSKLVRNASVRV